MNVLNVNVHSKTVKMVNLGYVFNHNFKRRLLWRLNEVTHVKHQHSAQTWQMVKKSINVFSLFYLHVQCRLQLETSSWINVLKREPALVFKYVASLPDSVVMRC